jgi:hypothetical protein
VSLVKSSLANPSPSKFKLPSLTHLHPSASRDRSWPVQYAEDAAVVEEVQMRTTRMMIASLILLLRRDPEQEIVFRGRRRRR